MICMHRPLSVKETLTDIRTKYWIVKGRSLVRSTIHRCVVCKRFEGAPYRGPPPPPLPIFRVQEEPSFTYTGVDFAGPLYVRTTGSSEANKTWICLFTCCVVRAVHLESSSYSVFGIIHVAVCCCATVAHCLRKAHAKSESRVSDYAMTRKCHVTIADAVHSF